MSVKLSKKILLGTCILASHLSVAAATESKFKVAIIEDSLGSNEIISGDYQASIARIKKTHTNKTSLEKSLGLCVAYLKSSDLSSAESACTDAIEHANNLSALQSKKTYIASLSYSNRAIARYLNKDIEGAKKDLDTALALDNNTVVRSNASYLASKWESTADTSYSLNSALTE